MKKVEYGPILQAQHKAPTSVAVCVGDHQAQAQLPLRYGVLVDQEPKCAAVDMDYLANFMAMVVSTLKILISKNT